MEHGFDPVLIAVLAAGVVVWGLCAARLERLDVSAPMVFLAVGLLAANPPLDLFDVQVHSGTIRTFAEFTLALVLFSDAARVNLGELRRDAAVPLRLLLLGLPLTIALGTLAALVLFPDLDPWVAAAIAAAVAPTDAALGLQVIEDPHVPARIRRVLNVESGLNDGIATPFVTFFLAAAGAELLTGSEASLADAALDLGIGAAVGAVLAFAGGRLLGLARRAGWSLPAARSVTVVGLALLAYTVTLEAGANGFIAAFVGGLAFGTTVRDDERDDTLEFDAQLGEVMAFAIWFLVGATIVSVLDAATWETLVFAVLALTAVRMLPVALVLVGARLDRTTVAFVGWFGPRGLASVVFGILAADALGGTESDTVLAAVALTVVLSVVAHGVTARPFARRYGAHVAALGEDRPERAAVPRLASRSRGSRATP